MRDIVERLRTDQAWNDAGNDPGGLQGDIWGEAADEIDRLRADNERLRAALDEINMASFPLERESVRVSCVPIGAWDNAMRALESK